jgi:hypothetical protein
MFTSEQKYGYSGGAIEKPKERIFFFQKTLYSDQTWFELFAEFLEQPNVEEVEAISFGWWHEESPDLIDDVFEDLSAVLEAVTASHNKLPNLRFLYVLDIDENEEVDDFFNSFTEYPSISASTLLGAFPKLEFLGIFACWIDDLYGLNSVSLKAFEWRVPYLLDLYNFLPYEKPQVLAQLSQSYLPNLETIALEVNPFTDYNAAIDDLRENNPFPNLSRIICPNPIRSEEEDDDGIQYIDLEMQTHEFAVLDKDLSFFASARIDLIGE